MSALIRVRIEEGLKREAEEVLGHLGVDLGTAVRAYLRQVVSTGSIPFRIRREPLDEDQAARVQDLANQLLEAVGK